MEKVEAPKYPGAVGHGYLWNAGDARKRNYALRHHKYVIPKRTNYKYVFVILHEDKFEPEIELPINDSRKIKENEETEKRWGGFWKQSG